MPVQCPNWHDFAVLILNSWSGVLAGPPTWDRSKLDVVPIHQIAGALLWQYAEIQEKENRNRVGPDCGNS
jgi:hypothetical protein